MAKEVSMWSVVPTRVRKSKRLTAEEKDLYYLLDDRLTKGGYCKDTNLELANMLNIHENTISKRLKSMQEKKFVVIQRYDHARRLIYLNIPGEPEDEPLPSEDMLQDKTERYLDSLKKAIVFGSIEFPALVEKLLESPYLENIQDNSRQFLLTEEQIQFLAKFKKRYPNKKIDCQLACYPNVNYTALLEEIYDSDLLEKNNLSLKWILEHQEDILNHNYKRIAPSPQNFKGRSYDDVDVNVLF